MPSVVLSFYKCLENIYCRMDSLKITETFILLLTESVLRVGHKHGGSLKGTLLKF